MIIHNIWSSTTNVFTVCPSWTMGRAVIHSRISCQNVTCMYVTISFVWGSCPLLTNITRWSFAGYLWNEIPNERHWKLFRLTNFFQTVNSPWWSDTIRWHRSESALAQVMACCLTTPSHLLNQCWFLISNVLLYSFERNFKAVPNPYFNLDRDIYLLIFPYTLQIISGPGTLCVNIFLPSSYCFRSVAW